MDKQDEILEKIKKAMRLARKAGTDGERQAAENAAKRLADAHGIRLEQVEACDADAKATKRDSARVWERSGKEVSYIINIIRKHFGVVTMQTYRPNSQKMTLTFFGCAINIDIAEYVYEILWRESKRAWEQARNEVNREYDAAWKARYGEKYAVALYGKRPTLIRKDAFMTGWFMKIDRKLTEHPLRNDIDQFKAECNAAEKAFKAFEEQSNGGIQHKTTKQNHGDKAALYRGYMMADSVNLSRPCEGRATASPFALAAN